jgi:arylsulfatase A-like enzyme
MRCTALLASAAICMTALVGTTPGLALAAPMNHQAPQAQPRNIIFILVDDLRFDGMGFLRSDIKTPNIDRLARGGSYFPNTRVTSSLCSPSRASILTGQSTRNHGVVDNNDSSEERLVFFPRYLQQAGYQTALMGKWHMGMHSDAPRPGFDKWVSFLGQGEYAPKGALNVDGRKVARTGYITDELTQYALNWLERERDPKKPFFLYLSHKAVHSDIGNAVPPDRHAHDYDATTFPVPATAADTPENRKGKPLWVQNQRNSWHGAEFPYYTENSLQHLQKNYYGALSGIDDSVGQIMAYLKRAGLEKNTMVVFTSDNGFLFGEHGLIDKRNAYEASVRVPLVIYAPGLVPAGRTNPGQVTNMDFAPTFLEMAGVARPPQFEGQSTLPLITGRIPATQWKPKDFIYEYYWEWNFPMTPTTFAITRGEMKYIQYHGVYDTEELYDLAEDPQERSNLIEDPAYRNTRVELRKALYQQLANSRGQHVVPFTARSGKGAVSRNRNGSGAADFPEGWVIDPKNPARYRDLAPEAAAAPASARD